MSYFDTSRISPGSGLPQFESEKLGIPIDLFYAKLLCKSQRIEYTEICHPHLN